MGRGRRTSPPTAKAGERFDLKAWAEVHYRHLSVAVLALFAILALLVFDPMPFVGGDNAAYVALSKSLAQGRGLSEIWTPEGKPHTQYPFGFPLLLSPISALGLPYAWYKLVPWLSGLLSLLAFVMLARERERTGHLVAALLLALSPHYLEYTRWVLSELPFTLFVMLTFLSLQKWEKKNHWLWLAGTVSAAAAANHIRSAGLALYLGVFIYLLIRRKFWPAGFFLAGCLALSLPWALRNSHYGTSGGYLEQFLMRDPYQPELGHLDMGGLGTRLLANLRLYGIQVLPRMFFPAMDAWELARAAWLAALLTVIPAILMLGARLFRNPGAYDWFVVAYLGLSLLWPEAWSDVRFLLPLLPFLLLYLVQAYGLALSGWLKERSRWPAVLLAILLATASLAAIRPLVGQNLENRGNRTHDRLAGYDPAWRSFFAGAEWVKGNTPDSSIVVSRKPTLFHLVSGRRSFCYPFTADVDSLRRAVDRADYVMVEPVSGTGQRYLVPAVQPLLDKRYKIIYAQGAPPTYGLKILKEPSDARRD